MKAYYVCLALKIVKYKPYNKLQLLIVSMHYWKNLSIDFVMDLLVSINQKSNSYDLILVIVVWLTKMIYYKLVKVIIDIPKLVKVIINRVVWYHNLPNLIVNNRSSLFNLKFWLSLFYFFEIKQKIFIAFYPQTDSHTECQNSTMKAYLQVFINFKQNDWARLLSMAKFPYNNTNIANTYYIPFKFNCGYYF